MSYEDILIRESTGEGMGMMPWCSACEREAEDCICEELSDHLRETVNPDSDVSVPAESGVHHLPLPDSFEDWLKQNEDSIIQ